MAQLPLGYYPIDAYATSGEELSLILNAKQEADLSMQSGIGVPDYAVKGTVWMNTANVTHIIGLYTGTQTLELYSFDSLNQKLIIDGGTF